MEIEFHEFPLTLRIPRSAFIVPTPPATVTQRTVEQHFGIPPRIYRRMIRDGLFPARKIGRLLFATYEDVRRAVTTGTAGTGDLAALDGSQEPKGGVVEDVVGYLAPSKATAATRASTRATADDAWDLIRTYGEKLPDGSPNPTYDPALLREGFDMLFATVGLRRPGAASPGARGAAGRSAYGKCCWCEKPAYATKQTWMADEWFWNGGPVCEACARARKPNERVVRVETMEILFPPRDPSVPQGWDRPRRPRRRP